MTRRTLAVEQIRVLAVLAHGEALTTAEIDRAAGSGRMSSTYAVVTRLEGLGYVGRGWMTTAHGHAAWAYTVTEDGLAAWEAARTDLARLVCRPAASAQEITS